MCKVNFPSCKYNVTVVFFLDKSFRGGGILKPIVILEGKDGKKNKENNSNTNVVGYNNECTSDNK